MMPPRHGSGSLRKHRAEEITMGVAEHSRDIPHTTEPMYSSFKTKQGHWPGYAPKTETRKPKPKRADKKAPGPGGDGAMFSSFKHAEPIRGSAKGGRAKTTFGNVPRRDEWIGDQRSPGVGQYDTSAQGRHRKDFRNPHAAPLFQGGSEPRRPAPATAASGSDAPGPADYAHQYSSFSKATAKKPQVRNREGRVATTFGNAYNRDTWRQESEAPGPCKYDIHDPLREELASKKSFRSPGAPAFAAGTKEDRDGRPIHGEVKAVGVVPQAAASAAGPGDYQAKSDFDISRRTFNTYFRQDAEKKQAGGRRRVGSMAARTSQTSSSRRRARSHDPGRARRSASAGRASSGASTPHQRRADPALPAPLD